MVFVHGILFLTGFGMLLTYILYLVHPIILLRIHQKFYVLFTFVLFKLTKIWMVFQTYLWYSTPNVVVILLCDFLQHAFSLSLVYHWDKGLLLCKIDLLWWISPAVILIFVYLDLWWPLLEKLFCITWGFPVGFKWLLQLDPWVFLFSFHLQDYFCFTLAGLLFSWWPTWLSQCPDSVFLATLFF